MRKATLATQSHLSGFPSYPFYGGNVARLLVTFFSLPLSITLVAASISHFLPAATKFSCCSSNKKMSPFSFFLSLSLSVALFLVELR